MTTITKPAQIPFLVSEEKSADFNEMIQRGTAKKLLNRIEKAKARKNGKL